MFDLLCVTNRLICEGDFLEKIRQLTACGLSGVILREKDLEEVRYRALAAQVMETCGQSGVLCIQHSFHRVAAELGAPVHLPMPVLREMSEKERSAFEIMGASCHSVDEAREAQALGCTYITAGHVFATDCKKGLAPRGTGFLREVCEAVNIPVYGIGGIGAGNIAEVQRAGAKGACVMSGAMTCADPERYVAELRSAAMETPGGKYKNEIQT